MSIEWYAVHTYVGHEEKVKQNILSRANSLGIADRPVEGDRRRDALEADRAQWLEEHSCVTAMTDSPVGREDLSGSRIGCDPGREVDGCAVDVAVLEDHWPGVAARHAEACPPCPSRPGRRGRLL